MHRTQILLEDRQYRLLRERARRQGVSMAGLIRAILDRELSGPPGGQESGLWEIVGIDEGDASAVSERTDRYLYGKDA